MMNGAVHGFRDARFGPGGSDDDVFSWHDEIVAINEFGARGYYVPTVEIITRARKVIFGYFYYRVDDVASGCRNIAGSGASFRFVCVVDYVINAFKNRGVWAIYVFVWCVFDGRFNCFMGVSREQLVFVWVVDLFTFKIDVDC